MTIRFRCPSCQGTNQAKGSEASRQTACPHCGTAVSLDVSDSLLQTGVVERCALCREDKLYVQRDFNRNLGLAIVAVAGIVSFWLYGRDQVVWSFGVLFGAVVVDFLLYWTLPSMTICYVCQAEYRKTAKNPAHEAYELALAEKYEQIGKALRSQGKLGRQQEESSR
ncbi:MAG: hypothetical protein HY710_13935 [Candidatus Latescibacteria bacterium]|nr:hypothetical protein [Candidatus Latescibacterota bacterium]